MERRTQSHVFSPQLRKANTTASVTISTSCYVFRVCKRVFIQFALNGWMETFFQTTITPLNLQNQNSSSGLGRNMQWFGSEHHFFTTVQLAKRSWWQPNCWYCTVEKCAICQNSSHNCHLNGARSTAGLGKNFICQPWLIHSWKKNKTYSPYTLGFCWSRSIISSLLPP